jgi:hypothetical protein
MMEGDIWVESESGKGSIFHFTARFACRKIKPAIKSGHETGGKGWPDLRFSGAF